MCLIAVVFPVSEREWSKLPCNLRVSDTSSVTHMEVIALGGLYTVNHVQETVFLAVINVSDCVYNS